MPQYKQKRLKYTCLLKGVFQLNKKIYLSPSMQSNNLYAYGNTNEMEQCNKIASLAKTELEKYGFEVLKSPIGQSIQKSINESNSWGSDLHVIIHTNAFNGKTTGGTLVMIYSNEEKNKKAGESILNAVAPISPGKDYTLKTNPQLAELNSTKAIAVYIEIEFHDTIDGAKWIIENTKSIAQAITKGICNYFGENYNYQDDADNIIYRVQAGSFKSKENAEKHLQNLKNMGFTDAFIRKETIQ